MDRKILNILYKHCVINSIVIKSMKREDEIQPDLDVVDWILTTQEFAKGLVEYNSCLLSHPLIIHLQTQHRNSHLNHLPHLSYSLGFGVSVN